MNNCIVPNNIKAYLYQSHIYTSRQSRKCFFFQLILHIYCKCFDIWYQFYLIWYYALDMAALDWQTGLYKCGSTAFTVTVTAFYSYCLVFNLIKYWCNASAGHSSPQPSDCTMVLYKDPIYTWKPQSNINANTVHSGKYCLKKGKYCLNLRWYFPCSHSKDSICFVLLFIPSMHELWQP